MRQKAFRSFPNRYLFSLYHKITSYLSIRYVLEIIFVCNSGEVHKSFLGRQPPKKGSAAKRPAADPQISLKMRKRDYLRVSSTMVSTPLGADGRFKTTPPATFCTFTGALPVNIQALSTRFVVMGRKRALSWQSRMCT